MEEFLGKRDYTGAMAVLEFNRHSGQGSEEVLNNTSIIIGAVPPQRTSWDRRTKSY